METILNILGGIALLLWGIRMVRTGVTRSFGAELRTALSVSAKNRFTAVLAGLGVTTAIQSSTATALIVSAFAGQGLIPVAAALAIMLGADVGTTLVVQILSFNLSWLSPLLLAVGVFGFLGAERRKPRNFARICIGLGLMLLALRLIVLASAPLRETDAFSVLLQPLANEPLLAVLVFALVTWASHSSVAVVLLVVSLVSMQVFELQLAFALVLGANLGGAMTAVGMTMTAAPVARRVPVGNLLMRLVGVLAVLPFLNYVQPYLTELDASPGRMVANFHMGFNLLLLVVFLPFLGVLEKGMSRLLPEKAEEAYDPGRARYLDDGAFDTPSVALACAARETLHMGDEVKQMLVAASAVFRADDDRIIRDVEKHDDIVDKLHETIKLYLTRLTKEELGSRESERCVEILSFTTNLEHIGDIVDKNLMELASKKLKSRRSFSTDGQAELEKFHGRIVSNLDLALNVFMSGDLDSARKLLREKTAIRELEREYIETHYQRIGEGRAESIDSSSLHLDVLRDLKRINSHLTSVAYPILERAGALVESRLVDGSVDEPQAEKPMPGDEVSAS
jgi:phosphate:Na+ symporter